MDLKKINSLTKYPSILTYHKLGEKGDRIGNPYGNIAEFLKPLADKIIDDIFSRSDWALTVIYQESYGGKTRLLKTTRTVGLKSTVSSTYSHCPRMI